MRWLKRWRRRLRAVIRKDVVERELEEELAHHLELEVRKNLDAGMSPEEARRQAAIAFGGLEKHKEAVRDARTLAWLPRMSLDFKLAFRMLSRYPGLTVVGGLAMAFAIAVGTTTYEIAAEFFFPPSPLQSAERMIGFRTWDTEEATSSNPSLRDFLTWREQLESVEEMGAFARSNRTLTTPEGTQLAAVVEISASAFRVGNLPPLVGRPIVATDEAEDAPAVAVLGYDLWDSRFERDPEVVGWTVQLGNTPITIVGVMPEGFALPNAGVIWVPLRTGSLASLAGQGPEVSVFGRLAPGNSLDAARAELTAVGSRMAIDFPETHAHLRPEIVSFEQAVLNFGELQRVWFLINVLVLMFVALMCGNIGLLLFARTITRESELAVRTALGASRRRIIGQLFAEALVLAGVAAIVGIVAADRGLEWARMRLLSTGGESTFSQVVTVPGIDPLTALYGAALALLAAVAAGVIPALRATGGPVESRLRLGSPGGGGARLGRGWTALIVLQLALAVAFPVVAFVVQQHQFALRSVDLGTNPEGQLVAELRKDRASVSDPTLDFRRDEFLLGFGATYEELEQRLRAAPGVVAVAFGNRLPGQSHPSVRVQLDAGSGESDDAPRGDIVRTAGVGLDYFDALDLPILSGRGFRPADLGSDHGVVIVNQSFVERVLDGRNPIGR